MNNRKTWRKTSRIILTFICSLSLFAVLVLGIMRITLFNQGFMKNAVDTSNYAETITTEINHTISDLGRGGNIPAEILSETVTTKNVNENIERYIYSIYTGSNFKLEGSEAIEEGIKKRIESYAHANNYLMDEKAEKAVSTLQEAATDAFQRYIEIPYLALYGKKIISYINTINLMLIFSVVVSCLLIAAIISLNGRLWHRIVRYLSYMIGGAGLMLTTLPTILYINRIIERLGISSKALYLFLTTYLSNFLLLFIKFGISAIVFSILLFLISESIRRKTIISKNQI